MFQWGFINDIRKTFGIKFVVTIVYKMNGSFEDVKFVPKLRFEFENQKK